MQREEIKPTPHVNGKSLAASAAEALTSGNLDMAISIARKAIALAADDAVAWQVLSVALHRAKLRKEALEAAERCVALRPQSVELISNLGAMQRANGLIREAEQTYRKAIALEPKAIAAWGNLGNLYRDLGRNLEAEQVYRKAIEINPEGVEFWQGLAASLGRQGRHEENARALERAIALAPGRADLVCDLAMNNAARGDSVEAARLLKKAMEIDPTTDLPHGNLGAIQLRASQIIAAEKSTRRAAELAPNEPRWISNLGVTQKDQGRFDEAERLYRRAFEMKPDYSLGHANLLFCLNYHPDRSAEEIFEEYKAFDRAHAKPHTPASVTFPNTPDPARKLRVGYLSPDFRDHAARHFLEPLLRHVDRSRIDLYCYAEVSLPDRVTAEFRALVPNWRSTCGLNDDELAALIRKDEIDVLVDFGGHTASSRLLVMARRVAPVQVEHYLGHGYTSGMTSVDFFVSDAEMAPAGSEHLFAERIMRLPRIPLAYVPPAGMPEPTPMPSLSGAPFTFGYFGRTERLNDRVVKAWSEILKRVPGSKLVLNSRVYSEPAFADLMRSRFAKCGIEGERLELVYTSPQPETWKAYKDVDIALDPFPHNAGTTTIEALWLGVPVVSVKDRPSVGRFGASILGSLGLSDWVAPNVDAYIDLAVTKALDRKGTSELRAGLRTRFKASPLYDGPGFARSMEAGYRAAWQAWCSANGGPSVQAPDLAALEQAAGKAYGDGDFARAVDLFMRVAALSPSASAYTNLGVALRADRRLDAAEAAQRRALEHDPNYVVALANLGNLLASSDRNAEAEEIYRRALSLKPDDPSLLRSTGLACLRQLKGSEADQFLRRAIEVSPDDYDAQDNLAQLVRQSGRLLSAAAIYEKIASNVADNPRILGNMGLLYTDLGRLDEAEALFRKALTLRPDYPLCHSNLLFCVNYHPDKTAEQIFEDYKAFDRAHAKPVDPGRVNFTNDRTPSRKLRLGYLSPDFRDHAARFFLDPLLRHFDSKGFELYCYAEVANPDNVTADFKKLATAWRSTCGLDDKAVADMIRADNIDILVDFGGHTSASRLLVMAHRAAPIQIEHFLGHGYTSGLSSVDVFIGDAEMAPAGSEHLFAERIARLPRIPLAYTPPPGMPDVAPLPSLSRKIPVTFGYFGRPERVNAKVVTAWSEILKRVPGSRLILNSKAYSEQKYCDLVAARFAAHGIGRERLELVYTYPQVKTWEAYKDVDIALDPFPHNAGTTTIEALWLGVPVVSIKGRPSVGRFGASILGSVGLKDWVADDIQSYINVAVDKAKDRAGLAKLRGGLRKRFTASPLFDGRGLTRDLEELYRNLWRAWCGESPSATVSSKQAFLTAAITALNSGDMARTIALAGEALAAHATFPEIRQLRGIANYRTGRIEEAVADLLEAIKESPNSADMRWNVTAMLRKIGRLPEALEQGREAVRLAPDAPEARNNLASVYKDLWRLPEAEEHLRHAVKVRPDYSDAWTNLSWVLSVSGNTREGEAAARTALAINANDTNAYNNLGTALMQQDRLQEAHECFTKAVELKPDFAVAHSNALFCLNYRTDLTPEQAIAAYRGWDEQQGRALMPKNPVYLGTRDPNRRLKIGYVSPDFRYHAVSFFVEGILAAHNPDNVEVTCYAEVANPDHVTDRFKRHAHRWRSTLGMTDEAVADMIRKDGIDVLIDLAGHTGNNRLLTFARKPAPVQVGHMVGSGTTTGLAAIDAMLIDGRLLPEGYDGCFTERAIRLSRMPLFYMPPAGMPEVGRLPALKNGHITFGCFSRPARINDDVIAAWCRILKSVPNSRLILNSKPFREHQSHPIWHSRFARHGIEPSRVDLIFTSPQPVTWDAYGDIDVALDPFPHNAGTTTIEALWLGVPVVSLKCRPPVGRFGSAILGSLGMSDWVVSDVDAYVARAVQAAANVRELAMLRVCLRDRFKASPLASDASGLASEIEGAYRALWREYCARNG